MEAFAYLLGLMHVAYEIHLRFIKGYAENI